MIAPAFNTGNKRDAVGAFHPEARAFCKALGINEKLKLFDNRAQIPQRRVECEKFFDSSAGLYGIVAFFGHGWRDGIQAGWVKGTIHKMAATLKLHCVSNPVILLYACDTGRNKDQSRADDIKGGPGGEGGFADMLRADCAKAGLSATIYAHTTEGHTTQNPYVRVFLPGEIGGGHWIVDPESNLWAAWKRALRSTDLRFRFPFMAREDIEAELTAAGPAQ